MSSRRGNRNVHYAICSADSVRRTRGGTGRPFATCRLAAWDSGFGDLLQRRGAEIGLPRGGAAAFVRL